MNFRPNDHVLGTKPTTPCILYQGKRRRPYNHDVIVPQGMYLCHSCDNPKCMNPEHFFFGTCSDNMIDCSIKGRISRGEDRPLHILTEELVKEIRNTPHKSAQKWAIELGCTKRTILMARGRITWKHV